MGLAAQQRAQTAIAGLCRGFFSPAGPTSNGEDALGCLHPSSAHCEEGGPARKSQVGLGGTLGVICRVGSAGYQAAMERTKNVGGKG